MTTLPERAERLSVVVSATVRHCHLPLNAQRAGGVRRAGLAGEIVNLREGRVVVHRTLQGVLDPPLPREPGRR